MGIYLYLYFALPGNAAPGKDYVDSNGQLTFDHNERHGRICVPILHRGMWQHDVHFEVELHDLANSEASTKAYLIVNTARVWIVNTSMYPGKCPEKPSPELLMHKFFIERCTARGKKCKVTAYCYVYKAFNDCIIETFCMVLIFRAAVYLEGWSSTESNALEHKTQQLMLSAIAVVALVLATKFAEWCDFTQLDQRGRSGTRKDLRNWLVDHYTQLGRNTSTQANIDPGASKF